MTSCLYTQEKIALKNNGFAFYPLYFLVYSIAAALLAPFGYSR